MRSRYLQSLTTLCAWQISL